MKIILSVAILASLFCSTVSQAEVTAPVQGTVQITVVDAEGNLVPDAPVYIYGERRTRYMGGGAVTGSSTFEMKEGSYRISSALVKRTGDYTDRFASNEAHIKVVAGDNISVVLTLNPLRSTEPEYVSYGTMHVAGLPGNQLNNN